MKKILFILLSTAFLNSCSYGKFLETETKGEVSELIAMNNEQHILQMDDKITVSIWDHDNVSLGSLFSIYSANETFGKWVLIDSVGNATLPKLGDVHLAGLNCKEAANVIKAKLEKEILNPVVVVKILNREVTILGEVKTNGNFIIDKEHTAVYEIIGKSGGFLQYANTKKIQLIRDNRSFILDLSREDVRGIHAVNVQSGDIIFVPAKRGKNFDLSIQRIIPFASAITAIAVFTTLLK